MEFPIYNTTESLQFICHDNEVGNRAIKALNLAMECIRKDLNTNNITQHDIENESARAALPRLSLFKFFGDIRAAQTDKEWIEGIFELSKSDYKRVRIEVVKFLPQEAKHKNITQNHARALKRDLQLFIHCCWVSKLVLIPVSFSPLPTLRNCLGQQYEWAFGAYPELLRYIRSPFCSEFKNQNITEYISEKSLTNLNWYAHRYIRACAAWVVEDITPELLSLMNNSTKQKTPRTVDWYIALIDILPNKVRYTIADVYHKSSGGAYGKTSYKRRPSLSVEHFPPLVIESNPNIENWATISNNFVNQLYDKGTKSYYSYSLAIGKVLKKLIAQELPVPLIRDINREAHIGVIKEALKNGVGKEYYREQLSKVSDFFDYVSLIEKGFSNPISKKLDLPIVGRRKGTNKEVVDEGVFAAFLSYLYGIAEWLWFISESYDNKVSFLTKGNNDIQSIQPASTGFQPLVYIKGQCKPIDRIPRQFVSPLFGHNSKNSQLTQTSLMLHFIHLAVVMAETGIRHMHLRWLDKNLYDEKVERLDFQERSYMPSKLHVNTDKSHGAWVADVSESVIGILDRQLRWRNKYLTGKDSPIPYDHFENSEFEDITPLFATTNSASTTSDNFSVVSDDTFRRHFKNFLIGFSWFYRQIGYESPLDISDCDSLDGCMKKWRTTSTNYTPHSMRSQVVSDNITMLPPSVIQRITGHSNDAHVLYYAKLNESWVADQQKAHDEEFKDFISPMFIDAKSDHSALTSAMNKDPLGALKDFGGISFGTGIKSGLHKVMDDLRENKDVHEIIVFNSTHMCPFTNKCPPDIENTELKEFKTCGSCPYALKTVDHLPAIAAKIRTYADKSADLEEIISTAKESNSDLSTYRGEVALKKFYANEISAWTVTATCLEKMAHSLEHKDKWLVAKPEFLTKKLQSMKSSNELTNTLIRIEEALNSEEFLTPQLKAKVALFRNKILVQSGQFQKLISDMPTGTSLLSEFKGIIKGICDITGISVNQLPRALDEQKAIIPDTLQHTISLPSKIEGGCNG